ncbi:hypothetical protein PU06_16685 [Escherichia coli]|nr:hypothetical protein [Escherichia coli]EFN7827098.1 hypothetical protein [Escherichia coli]EFN8484137.1 hypothetical protein [Escherichia coli]EFN8652265.1 hypothetical protein [Escherichia coli]EFO0452181.1 hypothetical protein [Escherichia coli]
MRALSMRKKRELSSIINNIEKNICRLNSSPKERIDDFLSSFFVKDSNDVYNCKTIKVKPVTGEILEIPIINLIPASFMAMKKATFTVKGERTAGNIPGCILNRGKKINNDRENDREICLKEDGEVNFSIDFEATPPSETLSFFLEKNHKY